MQLSTSTSFLYQPICNCEIKYNFTLCSGSNSKCGIKAGVMVDKIISYMTLKTSNKIEERLRLSDRYTSNRLGYMNAEEYNIFLKEEASLFSEDEYDTVERFEFNLLNSDCNFEIFSKIVKKVGSQVLNSGSVFNMTPLRFVINFEKDSDILLKKIKLLLNFGAKITLADLKGSSLLNEALTLKLPIEAIQLIILSGGVLYQPISSDSQEILNEAMQRFIEKAQVIQAVFKSTTALFRFLPLEIQALIFKATFTP